MKATDITGKDEWYGLPAGIASGFTEFCDVPVLNAVPARPGPLPAGCGI